MEATRSLSQERQLQSSGFESLDDIEGLVRHHQSGVLRFVLSRVNDPDLAETVTQDCFLRAYESRNEFRGECTVRTWLIAIATNLIRDYTRTKRFRFWKDAYATAIPLSEIHDRVATTQPNPERYLLTTERISRMWGSVESLPQKQREVILLRFKREMKLSEIARTTGMTMNMIKAHLYRGLQTVRAQTDQFLPHDGPYARVQGYLLEHDLNGHNFEHSVHV